MLCGADAPPEYVWSRIRTRGSAPPPGCCHSLVCYRDRYLILFGGGSSDGASNAVHVCDLDTHTWTCQPTRHAELVAPRVGHTAVLYGDVMIVYGGQDVDERVLYDDVVALDVRTWTWSVWQAHAPCEPDGPGHRRLHTAHVVQHRMYVFMGEPCHTSTMCWYLDLRTRAWHALPFGSTGGSDVAATATHHNNSNSNRRQCLFSCPALPLVGHGSVVDGEYAYVVCGYRVQLAARVNSSGGDGGNNSNSGPYSIGFGRPVSYSSAVYRYHFASNAWSELRVASNSSGNSSSGNSSSSMPAPRYAGAVAVHRGTLYLYGGDTNHNAAATYYDDYWSLPLRHTAHAQLPSSSPSSLRANVVRWVEQRSSRGGRLRGCRDAAAYPGARSGASCVVARCALYLVGGEAPRVRGATAATTRTAWATSTTATAMTDARSTATWAHSAHSRSSVRDNNTVNVNDVDDDAALVYDAALYRCPLSLSLSLSLRDNACRLLAQNGRGLLYAASEAALLPSSRAQQLLRQYIPSARQACEAHDGDSNSDDNKDEDETGGGDGEDRHGVQRDGCYSGDGGAEDWRDDHTHTQW